VDCEEYSKRSKSVPAVLHSPAKKVKRKQWTDEQMVDALEAVRVNEAARVYGISPTTLKDRISRRVKHNTNPGPQKYLSCQEQKEFLKGLLL